MRLNVVRSFERIENDLSFEFHHRFLERHASRQGVVAQRGRSRIAFQNSRKVFRGNL